MAPRQRDIFPLPTPVLPHVDPRSAQRLSDHSRRRLHANTESHKSVHRCIVALNQLHDGSWGARGGATSKASLAQQSVLSHVAKGVADMGRPPVGLTAEGALRELRGSRGYDGENLPSTLAPLDISLLSLPDSDSAPVALESLWVGVDGHQRVEEFCMACLQPREKVRSRLELEAPPRPYNDPKLRDNLFYASFVETVGRPFLGRFCAARRRDCRGLLCPSEERHTEAHH